MTTVAALHVPGYGTVLGSDRQITSSGNKQYGDEKWVVRNGWAVGVTGAFRVLVLLRRHMHEMIVPEMDAFDVTESIGALLDKYKFDTTPCEGMAAPNWGSDVLLANNRGVWDVDGTLSALKIKSNKLAACGSGGDYATGAGHALKDALISPIQRVQRAIEAATEFDPYSGGKIWTHILHPGNINAQVQETRRK